MKTKAYEVFGSGSAWVHWEGDPLAILKFVSSPEYAEALTDDGDNGFIGYMSVPDAIVPEGIQTHAGAYPGPDPGNRTLHEVKVEALLKWAGYGETEARTTAWNLSAAEVMELLNT